jgi:serine/threonine-protein kinase
VRPDLPPELCAIVHKMMAKDKNDRYQTCAELLKDLNQFREAYFSQKTQLTAPGSVPSFPTSSTEGAQGLRAVEPRGWLAALAAATVLSALFVGGAVAWLRNETAVTPTPSAQLPPSPTGDGPLLTEKRKNEELIRENVQKYTSPGADPVLGIRHSIELALLYLKEDRLEEADQFFTSLIKNPAKVPAYRNLGRVGHAIVLARQDHAAESNRLFLELLGDKPRPGAEPLRFLLNQPQLRYEIARALEYNKANLRDQPLPPRLEALRLPPRPHQAGQSSTSAGRP